VGDRGAELVVFAGLPGSGKSTSAEVVAARLGAVWIRVDTLEAAMLRAGIPRSFETGLAAYLAARDLAEDHLRLARPVVIDAVNGVEEARSMWRELATRCQAVRTVVEVVCPDPVEHRQRVEGRRPPTPPLPAPTWAEVLSREYRPWDEPVLTLDSRRPVQENVERVLAQLTSGRPREARGPID
jgi:predicted kinase